MGINELRGNFQYIFDVDINGVICSDYLFGFGMTTNEDSELNQNQNRQRICITMSMRSLILDFEIIIYQENYSIANTLL